MTENPVATSTVSTHETGLPRRQRMRCSTADPAVHSRPYTFWRTASDVVDVDPEEVHEVGSSTKPHGLTAANTPSSKL